MKKITSQQSDILYLSCENRWHDMFWGQVWIYLNAKQFWNHVSGALRLWDLTKEMTHNNPVMILDTNP